MVTIEKHSIGLFDFVHGRSLLRFKIFLVIFVLLILIFDRQNLSNSQPALFSFFFSASSTISFLLFDRISINIIILVTLVIAFAQ